MKRRNPGATLPTILLLVFMATVLPELVEGRPPQPSMIASLIFSLVSMWAVLKTPRVGVGIGPVFLGFYWVFHFSLVMFFAAGYVPQLFNSADSTWATEANLAGAAVPATTFMLWFAAAYLLPGAFSQRMPVTGDPDEANDREAQDGSMLLAPLVLLLGLAMWFWIWLGSGVGVAGQYVTFLENTLGKPTPYAYLLISMGMGLMGGVREIKGLRRLAVVLFFLWMVPAFLLGLRGEVLIPLLAFAVGRSRSGRLRITAKRLMLVVVGGLSAGSFVRVARVGGIPDLATINPLNGLVELGYTMRPMVAVQQLHDAGATAFVGLGTYLAPVERLVMGRILGQPTTDVTVDMTVFGSFIAENFGPIGGSVSAEAYRSGGLLVVAGVAIGIGLLSAVLDRTNSTKFTDALVAVVAGVLLLWVRNDFTPVPLSILIMALLFGTRSLLGSLTRTPSIEKGQQRTEDTRS